MNRVKYIDQKADPYYPRSADRYESYHCRGAASDPEDLQSVRHYGRETTSQIVIFYAVCSALFWPLSFTLPATFRASGDARMCMIISVTSMWIFRVIFSYVLGKYLGHGSVWRSGWP